MRNAYEGGASIRTLVGSTGRSYGSIHSMLRESGTTMRSRGGPNHRTRVGIVSATELPLPDRTLDQIEDRGKQLSVFTGGHLGHQPVENQVQVALQHVTGNVVADPSGQLLPAQPIDRRRRQLR